MQPFTEELLARQGSLTDEAFAALLGLDRTSWLRVRRGERRPSARVVEAAIRRWPELGPLYLVAVATQRGGCSATDNVKAERSA